MLHAAQAANIIARTTESSWQFIVQLAALTSGSVREDDYAFEITSITGKTIKVKQGK